LAVLAVTPGLNAMYSFEVVGAVLTCVVTTGARGVYLTTGRVSVGAPWIVMLPLTAS
jgi:hypothetical protein